MIDRRQFLAGAMAMPFVGARTAGPPAPHAALFVYTRPTFRPGHAAIARDALRQRSEVHTSAFQENDGKPRLDVGPVNTRVYFWKKGGERGKEIDRAWPMVALLEYDGSGAPEAWIDWFRRDADSRSDDGWLLDPGVAYAEHMNRQRVVAQDDEWCHLAMPDTPTGTYVTSTEFVVRARVRWADGREARLGWWLQFDTPKARDTEDWHVERTRLADWRVTRSVARRGAVAVGPLDEPDRQLAVWGTERVFTFPPMPPGLEPARGRR